MSTADPLQISIVAREDARFDELAAWLLDRTSPHPTAPAIDVLERSKVQMTSERCMVLQAQRNGQLVGAVLACVHADRTAEALPPRRDDAEDVAVIQALLSRLSDELRRQGNRLITLYVPPGRQDLGQQLLQAGYSRTSDLLLLAAEAEGRSDPEAKSGWRIRRCGSADRQRLHHILAASAVDALDFPDLHLEVAPDLRLKRYAETGSSDERLWYLVERRREAVGCLLLADQPQWDRFELVYTGLEPTSRGHGAGRWLARHARWLVHQAGRSHVVAGVDAANDPAIAAYAAAGFVQADRRHVYYRVAGRRDRSG